MTVKHVRDRGQTPKPPDGKVLGQVDTVEQYHAVVKALEERGFTQIEEFHGEDGLNLFKRIHGFAFGESEEKFFDEYRQALQAGKILLAISTDASDAAECAEVAAAHGARFLVHFGYIAVTWMK